MSKMPALSIQQPHVEAIFLSKKKWEYRTIRTNKRGRVYIYASKRPAPEEYYDKYKISNNRKLPTGVIVGTVEITGCEGEPGDYRWKLENPKRLKRSVKPKNQPQPVWFYPFP